MPWVFLVLVVVLLTAFGLVLAGRLPAVPQPTRDRFMSALPPRPSASDIDQLRLPVVLRGYRMSEVDEALAILRNRVAELESATGQSDTSSAVVPDDQTNPVVPFAPAVEDG